MTINILKSILLSRRLVKTEADAILVIALAFQHLGASNASL